MVFAFLSLATALTFDFPSLSASAFNRPVPPCPAAAPAPVYFSHPLFERLDGAFAIGSNQCGIVVLAARRDPVPANRTDVFDWKTVVYRLTVPAGFEFVDATCADPASVNLVPRAGGVTDVSFRLRAKVFRPPTTPTGGNHFGIALRATGGTRGSLAIRADVPGVTNPPPVCAVELFTIPPVQSASPRSFGVGAYPEASDCYFPTAAGDQAFAEQLQAAGVNWLIPTIPAVKQEGALSNRIERWRAAGVRWMTPDASGIIANGYSVGTKHAPRVKDLFISAEVDGRPLGNGSLCPAAISEEREIFTAGVVPELKHLLAGCDGLWSNWEPFVFRSKGCFCADCRKRFAQFAGIAEDEVAADWPAGLLPGGRWYAEGCRFRSAQHVRVVRTIARRVDGLLPSGACGFIPGVCWGDLAPGWSNRWYCSEAKIGEAMPDLKWVNPFGPYVRWDSARPFDGKDGQMLGTFFVAREVRRQVDADNPPSGSKKLMAFPMGLIGDSWLTQPEWIRLAQETFFWLGWNASIPWRFPEGADARYWRAFAEASAHIAKYEGLKAGAQLTDEILARAVGTVPTRPLDLWYLTRAPQSLFQQLVFKRPDGRCFVVAFNFSDRQSLSFTLDPSVKHPDGRPFPLPPCSVRVVEAFPDASR